MPFTAEQFFQVFEKYNQAVFPAQFVLIAAALAAVMAARRSRHAPSAEIISACLAFFWLWAGVVYHLTFFTPINPAAYIFAALFVAQGLLFFYEGAVAKRLRFRFETGLDGILGAIFIVYALLIYPLIGYAAGRIYPSSPTFGAPCPVVIYTFGLLLWTGKKPPLKLLAIPLLWSVIGTSAAVMFGVGEDFGLLVAGTVGTAFIIRRALVPEKEVLS